jgi:hypothetical protein
MSLVVSCASRSGLQLLSRGRGTVYYRAYILDQAGHILRAVGFDCADDAAAKQMAARMVEADDIELWQRDRKVAVLYATRYRLYFYDTDGRLIAPAMIIVADSDDAAIAEADKRIGNLGAELWAGDHIIKEFASKH